MNARGDIDVSRLPTYVFGHHSLMWWGTLSMIVIESTVFAGAIAVYFYLRQLSAEWPPVADPPSLLYGTLNLGVLLVSAVPNHFTKKAAEKQDLRRVRIGLVVCLVFAAVLLMVRALEFGALNTRWFDNAYGSIVYALMLLHTAHLVTDIIDTVVLTVLMFTGPLEGRRFVDVSENAFYWWFVVISWLLIYATVYIAPRMT